MRRAAGSRRGGTERPLSSPREPNGATRPPGDPPPRPLVRRWILAALAVATFAAFSGVLSNSWIALDDRWYILDHPHVNTGVSIDNLVWFLRNPHGGNWHPITSYSHMLDVQLFGLNAGAHHAVSLAIHCLNTILLAWILHRMTGAWWRSVLVAALFGLHPLRVESVAWASERKDVLSMLFFLLTLDAYRRWVLHPGRLRLAAVVAALSLGLMSKPMLVTAPVLLLLLDIWPLGRLQGLPAGFAPNPEFRGLPRLGAVRLLGEKWPLFLVAGASAAATMWAQSASHAVKSTAALPLGERAANAVVSVWRYVGTTLWPVDLIPFYPMVSLHPALVAGCASGLVAVTALVAWRWRRQPHLAIGWGWYVVSLLPVIGLLQVGGQARADRYTYLPAVGLLIAVLWIPRARLAARIGAGAALVAACVLGVMTYRQVARWKDTRTLFTYTLGVSPHNGVALNCLALGKLDDGDEEGAIRDFQAAIASQPDNRDPYRNLAMVLNRRGEFEEALQVCEAGLRIQPDADLLERAALANLALGRLERAEALYRRAVAEDPGNMPVVRNLGVVRSMQGHPEDALEWLHRAERMDPDNAQTQFILGKVLYLQSDRTEVAIEKLRRAIRLRPDWAEPLVALSRILSADADTSLRDPAEAVRLASRAVELTAAGNVEALRAQAQALSADGRNEEAASAARSALALVAEQGPDSLVRALRQDLVRYGAR